MQSLLACMSFAGITIICPVMQMIIVNVSMIGLMRSGKELVLIKISHLA